MSSATGFITKREATPPPGEPSKERRTEEGVTVVTQAAKRGMTPPPQEPPKARKIEPQDWASPDTNGLFKTLPHLLQGAVNPAELVQIHFLVGENRYYPVMIPKFVLACLPYFEDVFSKGWGESQTNTFRIHPLSSPAYFHPRAIAFVAQNLQADCKIFKTKQTLSQLMEEFPKEWEEFGVILNDVVRIAQQFQIEITLTDCFRFVRDEMQLSDDAKLIYLDWSLNYSQDLMFEVISHVIRKVDYYKNINFQRVSFFRVLCELAEAKFPEDETQKKQILKKYFKLVLPDYTDKAQPLHAEVVLTVFECLVKLFPHFDVPNELFEFLSDAFLKEALDSVSNRWPEKKSLFIAAMHFCTRKKAWRAPTDTLPEKLKEFHLCAEYKWDEVLSINPHNVHALIHKAQVHHYSSPRSYEKAIELVTAALEIEPECTPALLERAKLHTTTGKFEDALHDYSRCIEIDPNTPYALYHRGELHFKMGNVDAALKDLTTCLNIDPNNAEALELRATYLLNKGNPKAALADLNHHLSLDVDQENAVYEQTGDCYRLLGDLEQAIANYTRVLYEGSEEPLAALHRGECYYRLGKLDEAIADFTECLDLSGVIDDNYVTEAFSKRGDCYRQKGKTTLAIKDFQSCLELKPDDKVKAFALARAADCYLQHGNLDATLRDVQACLELKIDISTRAFALARLGGYHLKKNELDEALTCLNESLKLAPNDVSTLMIRGECLLLREDRDAALKDFNFCLSLNSTPFIRGEYHQLMGNLPEAIRAYSQAERDHIPALLKKAECHRLNRQLIGAREDYRKAAEIDEGLAGQLKETIQKIEEEICQLSTK